MNTPEDYIADYVFNASEERDKLVISILSNPNAVLTWIRFNVEMCDWADTVIRQHEELKDKPNFFDKVDYNLVLRNLRELLEIQT